VVIGLIVANAALQVLFGVIGSGTVLDAIYVKWLALSLESLGGGAIWTLLTYGFLHDLQGISHLLFNMVALYFLAPPLAERWGDRAFLRFWLMCIVGGGVGATLFSLVADPNAYTVGASAAVMGLVGAWSWVFPNQRLLLFFVVPIPAKRIVVIAVVLDIVLWVTGSDIAIGAHFGGLLTAWLILNGYTRPRLLRTRWRKWQLERRRRRGGKARERFKVIDGGRNGSGGDDDDDPRYNIH